MLSTCLAVLHIFFFLILKVNLQCIFNIQIQCLVYKWENWGLEISSTSLTSKSPLSLMRHWYSVCSISPRLRISLVFFMPMLISINGKFYDEVHIILGLLVVMAMITTHFKGGSNNLILLGRNFTLVSPTQPLRTP